ncbi:MAG: hypothetical protein ACE15B_17720 [Bryobacteraceae bacterium]
MPRQDFDRDFYEAALRGYEQTKNEIEGKIAELRNLLNGGRRGPQAAAQPQNRLSPEGRRRIAEAQKRRWAKVRRIQTARRGTA